MTVKGNTEPQPPPSAELSDQSLAILLSAAPEAPTVEDILRIDFSSGEPRPLLGLDAEAPLRARALMPLRARGDFLNSLRRYPDTARAKLERMVVIQYPPTASLDRAAEALRQDPSVMAVHELERPINGRPQATTRAKSSGNEPKGTASQYYFSILGIPFLHSIAGGWSLIGFIDNGIDVGHPELASFSGPNSESGNYLGGNYLPAFAYDFGPNAGAPDRNIDEAKLIPNPPGVTLCDPNGDGFMEAPFAGHGTNVAGIAAANSDGPDDNDGICKHCGIAMMKFSFLSCSQAGEIQIPNSAFATTPAFNSLVENGVQAMSMSFQLATPFDTD